MFRFLGILSLLATVAVVAAPSDASACGYGWWPSPGPFCYQWVYTPYYAYSQEDVPYYVAHPPVHYGWSILRPVERCGFEDVRQKYLFEKAPLPPSPPLRLVNPYLSGTAKSVAETASVTSQAKAGPLRLKNPFVL